MFAPLVLLFIGVLLHPSFSQESAADSQAASSEVRDALRRIREANPEAGPVAGRIQIRSNLAGDLNQAFGCAILPSATGGAGTFGPMGPRPREYELSFSTAGANAWRVQLAPPTQLGKVRPLAEAVCDGTTMWVRPFVKAAGRDDEVMDSIVYAAPLAALSALPDSLFSFGYGQGITPGAIVADLDRRCQWTQVDRVVVVGRPAMVLRGSVRSDAWADATPGLRDALATCKSVELHYDPERSTLRGWKLLHENGANVLEAAVEGVTYGVDLSPSEFGFPGAPGEKSLDLMTALRERKLVDPTATNNGSNADSAAVHGGSKTGPCVHLEMIPKHAEGHVRAGRCPTCDYNDKMSEQWGAISGGGLVVCTMNHESLKTPVACEHFVAKPAHAEGDPNDAQNLPLLASKAREWAAPNEPAGARDEAIRDYAFDRVPAMYAPVAVSVLESLADLAQQRRQENSLRGVARPAYGLDAVASLELRIFQAATKVGPEGQKLRTAMMERISDALDVSDEATRQSALYGLLLGGPADFSSNLSLLVSQLVLQRDENSAARFIREGIDPISAKVVWDQALEPEACLELLRATQFARTTIVETWAENLLTQANRRRALELRRERLDPAREKAKRLLTGSWHMSGGTNVEVALEEDEFVARVTSVGSDPGREGLDVGHELFRVEWSPCDDHPALPRAYYASADTARGQYKLVGPLTRVELGELASKGAITDETLMTRSDWPPNQQAVPFGRQGLDFLPAGRFFIGRYFPPERDARRARGVTPSAGARSARVWILLGENSCELLIRDGNANGAWSPPLERGSASKPAASKRTAPKKSTPNPDRGRRR